MAEIPPQVSASLPFRFDVKDNVICPSGVVLSLSLSSADRLRYLWCFYHRQGVALPLNLEAWIRFFNKGELVAEFPAALVPFANSRLGIAAYEGSANTPNTNSQSAGPDVLWWDTSSATAIHNPIHPFRLLIEADEVRLEHNQELTLYVMLACLSLPFAP